jgi:hypothetical protein
MAMQNVEPEAVPEVHTPDPIAVQTVSSTVRALTLYPFLIFHPVAIQDDSVERYRGSTHQTSGKNFTHFDFDVVAVKDRVHLEQNLAITAVSCTTTGLTVAFNSTTEAAAFATTLHANSTVITVVKEWGCRSGAGVKKVAIAPAVTISANGLEVP